MSKHNDGNGRIGKDQDLIEFNLDKPFRMFVGEINGNMVKNISAEELKGFKDGDKVVIMHSEDWLWFINQLLKKQPSLE